VVACQAENNIPVVGKDQVARGREMHWIRIDTYYSGSLDAPETFHEPVPCMQCENAPCELVCPVGATLHDDEGINNMVYNRCVGTRYCSNNCPYKVRHFNFYQYSDQTTESLKLLNNPDVTVRTRGVMEKCTYCIQRINEVRIDIEKTVVRYEERAAQALVEESRKKILEELNGAPDQPAAGLRHRMLAGLQTACQQSCPTEAIIFGDLNDTVGSDGQGSLVRRLRNQSPLDYGLLEELNTKPRTRYLARITNPNPAMPAPKGGEA
jgi:molybdopterin-containing oxidoreductase family iron-sulfur binding subunit